MTLLLFSCKHSDRISESNISKQNGEEVSLLVEPVNGDPHRQHDQGLPEYINTIIDKPPTDEAPSYENPFAINGRLFSIEEINTGIKDTFNNQLYLYGYVGGLIKNDLPYDIEYELYFDPSHYGYDERYPFSRPKTAFLVVTNMLHPLPMEEIPPLYVYGINVTEWGLRSDFYYSNTYTTIEKPLIFFNSELVYLGSYTVRIDEIAKPQYEIMDSEWIENTKNEIRMYMDEDVFSEYNIEKELEPGGYHVYVKKFFKSDVDSTIIFEHENGNIYTGWYNYVHENTGVYPANLNHVELVDNLNEESFKTFLEKVREDPALCIEYAVN